MKAIFNSVIVVVMMVTMLVPTSGQQSVNHLFKEMKKQDYTYALTVPKFLVKYGIKKALQSMNEGDREKFAPFISNISKVRLLINEKMKNMETGQLSKYIDEIQKDKFDLYASVKSEGNLIKLFARENKDILEDLFFVINGDDGSVLLHLKTNIASSDFEKAQLSFSKKGNIESNL